VPETYETNISLTGDKFDKFTGIPERRICHCFTG